MQAQISVTLIALVGVVLSFTDKQLYSQHKQNNNRYPCGEPQPRVFRLEDVLEKNQLATPCEKITPHVSVLHRCDFASGCCLDYRSCQPNKTEEVTLVFQVIRIPSKKPNTLCSGDFTIKYIQAKAVNHTECVCRPINNSPK